jgi:hypothetical protein
MIQPDLAAALEGQPLSQYFDHDETRVPAALSK